MSTLLKCVLPDAATYTNFAAWAQWMFNAFTTFGWVQTSDFGQVNWTNLATSNVVPLTSPNATFTPSSMVSETVGTGAGGVANIGGSGNLVIALATTTNYAAGRAVQISALTGGAASLNGLIFTITSVVASTSITLAVPTTGTVGGINWATGFSFTVTSGSVIPVAAFGIFESQDSLTTSTPIYVKIAWAGTSSSNAQWIQISIGVGGTNGYGSLVGNSLIFNAQYSFTSSTSQSTSQMHACYASGDSGSIRFGMFMPTGQDNNVDSYSPMLFVISRSRDANGNATSLYVMYWGGFTAASGLSTSFGTVFNSNNGVNIVDTTGSWLGALPRASTGANGGTTLVTPIFQNVGSLSNPTPDLLGCFNADFPIGTNAVIPVYSTNHNYISIRGVTAEVIIGPNTATNSQFLMRFE